MKSALPDIDLPVDFFTGIDIDEDILGHYRFPCRIHAAVFVLCLEGELEATINLKRYRIKKDDLVAIIPGTIIQFHCMAPGSRLGFVGFSHSFFYGTSFINHQMDFFAGAGQQPVLPLSGELKAVVLDFFMLMHNARIKNQMNDKDMLICALVATVICVRNQYMARPESERLLNKGERIYKELNQLVMRYFETEKRVTFYAEKMGITPQHLSSTVRKVSGKTVSDVISEVVITDAKSKLKSTTMSIQEISDSLNFPNASFFGKYFKRYTNLSPKEYRQMQ